MWEKILVIIKLRKNLEKTKMKKTLCALVASLPLVLGACKIILKTGKIVYSFDNTVILPNTCSRVLSIDNRGRISYVLCEKSNGDIGNYAGYNERGWTEVRTYKLRR